MPLLFLSILGIGVYFLAKHAGVTVSVPDPNHNLPGGLLVANFASGPPQQSFAMTVGQQIALILPSDQYDAINGDFEAYLTKVSGATQNKDGTWTAIFGASNPGTGRIAIVNARGVVAFTLDFAIH
jgi:hypothetical protein